MIQPMRRLVFACIAGLLVVAAAAIGLSVRTSPPPTTRNGYIAFVSNQTGRSQIFVMRPDGGKPIQLVADRLDDNHPAWSPNGSKLAFDGGVPNDQTFRDIFVVGSDGSHRIQLTDGSGLAREPSWSPDGQWIMFDGVQSFSPNAYTVSGLFKIRPDGKGETIFKMDSGLEDSGCIDRSPAWSPDGRRIAFLSLCSNEPSSIHVMTADMVDDRAPVQGWGIDAGPSWSPDGKTILFGEGSRIEQVGTDGRGRETLATVPGSHGARFSPDGARIVFQTGSGQIYVMNADGSGQSSMTRDRSQETSPSWQPLPMSLAPPPAPSPAPSPTPSPPPSPPRLRPECKASSAVGDFDGDFSLDVATVARTVCLTTSQDRADYPSLYAMDVRWGPVSEGEHPSEGTFPIAECRTFCRALAVSDLDADGTQELILEIGAAAHTRLLEILDLPDGEECCAAAIVARPGSKGYPAGQPIRLVVGSSVTRHDFVSCLPPGMPTKVNVIATHEILSHDRTTWIVHQTDLTFKGSTYPPTMKVITTFDYEVPTNPVSPTPVVPPGGSCWSGSTG